MTKIEVLNELRRRVENLQRWRRDGRRRTRYHAPKRTAYYASLRAWSLTVQADRSAHPILRWGADQLLSAADEHAAADYNAARCRLRRFDNALDRWETRNQCPEREPSRYTLAALKKAAQKKEGES